MKEKDAVNVEQQVLKILNYMKKYHVNGRPSFENYLSDNELKIRKDLDIILFALREGLRAKVGNPQTKDVKFENTEEMFDEIVQIVKRHLI